MKQIVLAIDDTQQTMYLRIAKAIRYAIKVSQLKPDEQLPSARQLASQLGVNRHTVMAAFSELIAEGWIQSRQRQGYYVMPALPVEQSISPSSPQTGEKSFAWRFTRPLAQVVKTTAADCHYNFAGGCPDIGLFPFKVFSSCLNDATLRADRKALNYGDQTGFQPFIEQIETYLRRVRSLTGKSVMSVNGSQEALFLLSQVLLKPGDKVAVERLGYQPAWSAFRSSGAELVGIEQDSQGIDVDSLEAMAARHRLRLIYLTPLHQYPTTVTLSVTRRLQIYRIAAEYQIPIVEDDYDHEFHYRCQPLAPMAADDPQGLVIYLSTFSKIMFPGVRIGFVAADERLIEALTAYRTITNHKPNVVMQDAIARWMADGAFERHLRKLTRIYELRRDFMVEQLNTYRQKGMELDFQVPDGGMALWIKTDRDTAQLAQKALQRGVYIQAENDFHLNPNDSENRYIRLGFAGMPEQKIEQGLGLLFGCGWW